MEHTKKKRGITFRRLIGALLCAYLVAVFLHNAFYPSPSRRETVRANDPCGPHHHWVEIYSYTPIADLSCEPD